MNIFYQIVKRLNIIIMIVVIVSIGATLRFLYSNMYKTIIQAERIVLLKGQIIDATFNEKLWRDITENLETKKSAKNISENVKDPFNF